MTRAFSNRSVHRKINLFVIIEDKELLLRKFKRVDNYVCNCVCNCVCHSKISFVVQSSLYGMHDANCDKTKPNVRATIILLKKSNNGSKPATFLLKLNYLYILICIDLLQKRSIGLSSSRFYPIYRAKNPDSNWRMYIYGKFQIKTYRSRYRHQPIFQWGQSEYGWIYPIR